MQGFKDFVLKGNLIELAIAFIMGTAFATVVTATVTLLMELIGKIGGQPDFTSWRPGGIGLGAWLTAVVAFLILAAIVYFLIVMPYTKAKERFFPVEAPSGPTEVELLTEIRDALANRGPSTMP